MRYVISDLHGEYEKFIKMLELINFTENDELYILGDVFDRKEHVLEIIEYIVNHKNIHLIKGNHEEFFENYYETGDTSIWFCNGGKTSMKQINNKPYIYRDSLYKYIHSLPLCLVIDNFILVHAGLYLPKNYQSMEISEIMKLQTSDDLLWDRSNIGNEREIEGYIIICGHTPVQTIDEGLSGNPSILKRTGHIYIDCGACFSGGKLACLRLDDMKEFYV